MTCTVLYLAYRFTLNTDLFIVEGLGKKLFTTLGCEGGLWWETYYHLRTQHEFPILKHAVRKYLEAMLSLKH